jgi:hypothetical protein
LFREDGGFEDEGFEEGGLEAVDERREGGWDGDCVCDCGVDCAGGALTRTGPEVEGPALDDIPAVDMEYWHYAILQIYL